MKKYLEDENAEAAIYREKKTTTSTVKGKKIPRQSERQKQLKMKIIKLKLKLMGRNLVFSTIVFISFVLNNDAKGQNYQFQSMMIKRQTGTVSVVKIFKDSVEIDKKYLISSPLLFSGSFSGEYFVTIEGFIDLSLSVKYDLCIHRMTGKIRTQTHRTVISIPRSKRASFQLRVVGCKIDFVRKVRGGETVVRSWDIDSLTTGKITVYDIGNEIEATDISIF